MSLKSSASQKTDRKGKCAPQPVTGEQASLTGAQASLLASMTNRTRLFYGSVALCLVVLVGIGVFAKNGWFPKTDPLSGKKTGWFGSESSPPYEGGVDASRGRGGSLEPAPLPSGTPQLSKEYIYASGSRLLAVEDANANAAPPADLAVWRPSNGTFYVLGGTGSAQTFYPWGANGDKPAIGDFDGDGKTDFSVFRPSTGVWWVVRSSDGSYFSYQFGVGTDTTAQADYDGDGRTDIAVWRPSTGVWYIVQSSNGAAQYATFGINGDTPAPADYDGDGRADIAVWRNSNKTFYSINSSNSQSTSSNFATSTTSGTVATPVSSDYDGDGRADYAIKNGNIWTIRNSTNSTNSTNSITWQQSGDQPVQNDYDGDGKCDIAIWRPGQSAVWWIRKSSTNTNRTESWGTTYDIPVPAYYRR